MGQALCKRTLDVVGMQSYLVVMIPATKAFSVEKLKIQNEDDAGKMYYFLSKADTAGSERVSRHS